MPHQSPIAQSNRMRDLGAPCEAADTRFCTSNPTTARVGTRILVGQAFSEHSR